MMMYHKLRSEFNVNKQSGVLTVLFMINYRIGHKLLNVKKNGNKLIWPLYVICLLNHRFLSMVFGSSIPFSCEIGKRVVFRHGMYGVFISGKAKIGHDCIIMHQVTIGSNYGSTHKPLSAPNISDGVFIGVGAKIIGSVNIGDNAKIGANALVVCDVPSNTICVASKGYIIDRNNSSY